MVVDPGAALDPDAPTIRDDVENRTDNHIFAWEAGDEAATGAVFARADVVVEQAMRFPRSHPAPMETCGAVAAFDRVSEKLTLWCTSQAPHAHRTVYAQLTGMPEHKIRVISPDIGGGFGNKVPVYPGYVCALVASIVTGQPVKWMEDRSENLMSTGFARDYVMRGEIAATAEGTIHAVRVEVLADHGAFNTTAQPSRYPAGFFRFSPAHTTSRRPTAASAACTRTRRPEASRTHALSGLPRRCIWSSGWSTASPTSSASTRHGCA